MTANAQALMTADNGLMLCFCPFCGHATLSVQRELLPIGVRHWLRCETCEAGGPRTVGSIALAMDLWNHRPACKVGG